MNDERFHERLLKLYEVTIHDIARTKEWQWTVFYHTVLAQGGLLALYSTFPGNARSVLHTGLFVLFSFIVCAIGASVLWDATRALNRFRDRLGRCYDEFGEDFLRINGARVKTTYHIAMLCAEIGVFFIVVCIILLR